MTKNEYYFRRADVRNPVYTNEESGETFYVGSMRTLEYITNLEKKNKELIESRDSWRDLYDTFQSSDKVTYYAFGCGAFIVFMIAAIIKMLK